MLLTMRYDYEYDEHNLVVVHDIIMTDHDSSRGRISTQNLVTRYNYKQ